VVVKSWSPTKFLFTIMEFLFGFSPQRGISKPDSHCGHPHFAYCVGKNSFGKVPGCPGAVRKWFLIKDERREV